MTNILKSTKQDDDKEDVYQIGNFVFRIVWKKQSINIIKLVKLNIILSSISNG